MNNDTLLIKLKQRLNNLDRQDQDNIECWQFVEAFNKAQVEWCRRNLHGGNMYKEGDELSKRRIDDLQPLLIELSLTGIVTDTYFETDNFPVNTYLEYKRVSTSATDECCTDPRSMTVYLAEEANVNLLLRDPLKSVDPYTGLVSTVNIPCEFKDDVAELMLDDAASLIAGDIENIYQQQRGQASAERNN